MQEQSPKTQLHQVWKRLEGICASLWADNSPRAVAAQALFEEFRSEMSRYDTQVLQVHDNLAQTGRDHEEAMRDLRSHYAAEMDGLKKRLELLDRLLKDKDGEITDLLARLAEQEKKNADFHSQILKSAAATEEATAHKMEDLYTALKSKEESLEGSWRKRDQALQAEADKMRDILAARQVELEAWEKRRISEEDALKHRATDLELKSQQLQQEYRLKQQEIETLKSSLQRSVTELVRQYQSRLKGEPEITAR